MYNTSGGNTNSRGRCNFLSAIIVKDQYKTRHFVIKAFLQSLQSSI